MAAASSTVMPGKVASMSAVTLVALMLIFDASSTRANVGTSEERALESFRPMSQKVDFQQLLPVEAVGVDGSLFASSVFVSGPGEVEIVEQRGRGAEVRHAFAGDDPYRLMVEHFADAVLTGEPVRYGISDAVGTMAVIEALFRSVVAEGEPMPVEDQVQ